jgi:D-amino-acid dehydrogenase
MMRSLVIVGGGVVGLNVARYARREGFEVTIVERGGPDHDSCSLENAGMVTPSHFVPLASPGAVALGIRSVLNSKSPLYIKPRIDRDFARWGRLFLRSATRAHVERVSPVLLAINMLGRRCFEEQAGERGNDFGLVRKGLLMLCRSERGLEEEVHAAEMAAGLGLPARVLSPAELATLEPGVQMSVVGGVHYPLDCHLDPQRFITGLTRELEQAGVNFEWNATAHGWRSGRDRIQALVTDRGEFPADEFVLAAGSWSPLLTRQLGLRLPVEAGKGYSLTLATPRSRPTLCAIFTEARIAVTPVGGGLRFAGTMEIAGLDQSITRERVRAIVDAVPTYFPRFVAKDFEGIAPWSGLRPVSPDGVPYIGRTRRYANFSVATGHAMMGLSIAPATGLLMAQVLAGREPEIPLEPFSPERFA